MLARSKWKLAAPTAVLAAAALVTGAPTTPVVASASPAPVQVSIFASAPSDVVNLNTNWFTLEVDKMFNMHINWVQAPASDTASKAELLLASGKYPDAFFNPGIPLASILKYGQEGVVVSLTNLIKQYAPNVAAGLNSDPTAAEAAGPPKGPVYDVPYYNYCWHCNWHTKAWISTQLLKQYGLSIPTTTAQFTAVLKAFKAHGVIPMTGAGPISSSTCWGCNVVTWLMNSFAYDAGDDNGSGYFEIGPGGKAVFSPSTAQWKAGLAYIHSLYQDGLIDSSALIQSNSDLQRELATPGSVGVFVNGGPNGAIPSTDYTGTGWLAVPPLKGPSGTRYSAFYGNGSQATTGMIITNAANSAQKEALMKLSNYMWTTVGTQTMDFGPPGKYWSVAKPGQLGLNGQQALYNTNFTEFYSTSVYENVGWNQLGPMDQGEAWRNGSLIAVNPLGPTGAQELLQFMTQAFYAGMQPKEVVPSSIWVSPTNAQTYASLETNIDDYVTQWADEFVDGSKSLSSDWGSYLKGLNGLSLGNYTALTQQAMGSPLSTASFVSAPSDVTFLEHLVPSSDSTDLSLFNAAYKAERG